MDDVTQLVDLLKNNANLVAMVAPSFPVMYETSDLIKSLKGIGFTDVVEVSVGAKKTNEALAALYKNNLNGRYITSPCASFVRLVRTKYPHLLHFLAFSVDSPMIATAKIVKEQYPSSVPVFIGPCLAKKKEASEDYPELGIHVITYKELEMLFSLVPKKSVKEEDLHFSLSEQSTRIYPMDGGLTETSGIRSILRDDEIRIVSGWKQCAEALAEFETNEKIRLLDILFCDGGCISGPGIISPLSLEERKKRVKAFAK